MAHTNDLASSSNRKLVFFRRPPDTGRGSVESENHEGRLPFAVFATRPHVRVTVDSTRDDHVRNGSPVYAGDSLLVLLQSGGQSPVCALLFVDLHFVVVQGDGYLCAVLVEGVASDRSSGKMF